MCRCAERKEDLMPHVEGLAQTHVSPWNQRSSDRYDQASMSIPGWTTRTGHGLYLWALPILCQQRLDGVHRLLE